VSLTATLKSLSGLGGGLLNPARPRSCTQQRLRRFYPKSSGLIGGREGPAVYGLVFSNLN
jgi:hypothetical protein